MSLEIAMNIMAGKNNIFLSKDLVMWCEQEPGMDAEPL